MSLDTACSSSMTAVDLACQGLHSRDTDMVQPYTPTNINFDLFEIGYRCRRESSFGA